MCRDLEPETRRRLRNTFYPTGKKNQLAHLQDPFLHPKRGETNSARIIESET